MVSLRNLLSFGSPNHLHRTLDRSTGVLQSLGTPCGGRAEPARRLVPQSGERAVRVRLVVC